MPIIFTLKRNNDYRRIYAKGKYFTSPIMVTYVKKNGRAYTRMGITASKKIGKAVKRNRARRIIREAYRTVAANIPYGYDIVFVARGKTPYVKSTDIIKAMQKHLQMAGVVR